MLAGIYGSKNVSWEKVRKWIFLKIDVAIAKVLSIFRKNPFSNFFSGHIFWPKNAWGHQNLEIFWYSLHPIIQLLASWIVLLLFNSTRCKYSRMNFNAYNFTTLSICERTIFSPSYARLRNYLKLSFWDSLILHHVMIK